MNPPPAMDMETEFPHDDDMNIGELPPNWESMLAPQSDYLEFNDELQEQYAAAVAASIHGQPSSSATMIGLSPEFILQQQYNGEHHMLMHDQSSLGIAATYNGPNNNPNLPDHITVTSSNPSRSGGTTPTSTDLDPADVVKKARKKETDRRYRENHKLREMHKDTEIKDLTHENERLKGEIAYLTSEKNERISLLESENNRLMGVIEMLRQRGSEIIRSRSDLNNNTSDVEISEEEDDDDDDLQVNLPPREAIVQVRRDMILLKGESKEHNSRLQILSARLDLIEKSNHKQKNSVQSLVKKLKRIKVSLFGRRDH